MKAVFIDRDNCVSCGLCAQMCDTVFRMGGDEKAEVIDGGVAPEEKIKEVIDSCPAQCIHWKE